MADSEEASEGAADAVAAPLRLGLVLTEAQDEGLELRTALCDADAQRVDDTDERELKLIETDALDDRETRLEFEARGDGDSLDDVERLLVGFELRDMVADANVERDNDAETELVRDAELLREIQLVTVDDAHGVADRVTRAVELAFGVRELEKVMHALVE